MSCTTLSQGSCGHFDLIQMALKRHSRQLCAEYLLSRASLYKGSPPKLQASVTQGNSQGIPSEPVPPPTRAVHRSSLCILLQPLCVRVGLKRHPRQLCAEYLLGRATPYKGRPPKLRTSVTQGSSRGTPSEPVPPSTRVVHRILSCEITCALDRLDSSSTVSTFQPLVDRVRGQMRGRSND